jgi:hypothetical protein
VSVIPPAGFGAAAWILTGADGTSPFITTMGVEVDPVEDTEVVANHLFNAYAETWLGQTGNVFTLERCVLTLPIGNGTVGTVESTVPSEIGALSGERCSMSMALLVNKRTGGIGRRSRGRMFIPGVLPATAVDTGGNLESTTVASYQQIADIFLAALAANAAPFPTPTPGVLLHSDAGAPTPVTQLTVSTKVGSLRRRIR